MSTTVSEPRFAGIILRPVLDGDAEWAYHLETDARIIQRFRLAGSTPSPQAYRRFLTRSGGICRVVVDETNGERVGFVYTFNMDLDNARTSIALVADPRYHGSGKLYRGAYLFIDYLFRSLPIERLYGQSVAFNVGQFSPDGRRRLDLTSLFRVEAVLRDHTYAGGRWWDEYLTCVTRDMWDGARDDIRRFFEGDHELERQGIAVEGRHGRDAGAGADTEGIDGAALSTSHAVLRAFRPSDVAWVTELFSNPRNNGALRIAGAPADGRLSAAQVDRLLWQGVLCQFVVEDTANGFRLGLLTAHRMDWPNLALSLHAVVEPGFVDDLAVLGAVPCFVSYLFDTFPVRKLYVEYPDGEETFALLVRALAGRDREVLRREGLLQSWMTVCGRRRDVVVASISRSDWEWPAGPAAQPGSCASST
jgi:RimJ/RimL family protein N-acetyltransferase